jgi:hypothetical protein
VNQTHPVPTPPRWLSTTPERVARRAVRAVRRNQAIALVTPVAYFTYYLKRFAPGLLDWVSHFGQRAAMKKKRQRLARKAPTYYPHVEFGRPREQVEKAA